MNYDKGTQRMASIVSDEQALLGFWGACSQSLSQRFFLIISPISKMSPLSKQ